MEQLIRLTAFKTLLDVFLAEAIEAGKQETGEWASDESFDFSEKNPQLCDQGSDLTSQPTNKLLLQTYLDAALHSNPGLYNEFRQLLNEFFVDPSAE